MQDLDTQTSIEVNFSPLLRRYTLEEFWALPEREDHARYNLIGGFLFRFRRQTRLTGMSTHV
jgi:hypothetical protein